MLSLTSKKKNTQVNTISAMYDVEVVDMLRKALLESYIKDSYETTK